MDAGDGIRSVAVPVNPAQVTAVKALHAEGIGVREISAQLSLPLTDVQQIVRTGAPAASRDERLASLLERAAASPVQRTRLLGERLKALLEDLGQRLAREEMQRELKAQIDELSQRIVKARKQLRGVKTLPAESEGEN
jgi:hypothetical protein